MKTSALLVLFFSINAFVSCWAQEVPSNPSSEYYPTVKKSIIKNFELKEGRHAVQFALDNGEKWDIQISIPALKDGEKVPLILALHWGGGEALAYQEFSECLAFPAFETLKGIIIAPSAGSTGNWLIPENEKKVIKLVKQIIKLWPIDSKKVIISGYSNGGIGSWHFSKKHPNLFAAVLPMAAFYKEAEKIKAPLYILHGEKDELFNVEEAEATLEASKEKGSKITYKRLPEFSHFMACTYLDALKEMVELMAEECF